MALRPLQAFSSSFFILITFCPLLSFHSPIASATSRDTPSLLAISSSLLFSRYPALASWRTTSLFSNPCSSSWRGVSCNTSISPRVVGLDLHGLSLSGRFPAAVAALSELRTLDLHGNRLFGPIPPELANLKHLVELNLAENLLYGAIPAELSFLERLQVLDLHMNRLSGSLNGVFSSTGGFPELTILHLNDNSFQGELPTSLGLCRKLRVLDVSQNSLSGVIPSGLAKLSQLRYFNVCNNDLFHTEGPILQGQCSMWDFSSKALTYLHHSTIAEAPNASPQAGFGQKFTSFWFEIARKLSLGKAKVPIRATGLKARMLVGGRESNSSNNSSTNNQYPYGNTGPPPTQAPCPSAAMDYPPRHKNSRVVKWLSGIALGIVAGAVSAIVCSTSFRLIADCIKRPKPGVTMVFQHKFIKSKDFAFLNKDDSLDSLEVLGKGGSGLVYKAVLETGKTVAIKKVIALLSDPSKGTDKTLEESYDLTRNSKQVFAELNTLGQVRHRNLVALLAYIPKPNAHLLIYDFMENGSLRDALMRVENGTLDLTWPMRYKIALGTAMGLQYLHFESSPKIVHRDLKPGNILLDQDMEAHIGDFGIAKIMPDSFTHFSTTNVAGTVGYIAPEYNQTLRYTAKGDVYSYGVVLAVLLTGKEPTDDLFSEVATSMGNWIMDVMNSGEENTIACFHPSLRGKGYDGEMILAFKLAAYCVQENPASRPTSDQVVKIFRTISKPSSASPPSSPLQCAPSSPLLGAP